MTGVTGPPAEMLATDLLRHRYGSRASGPTRLGAGEWSHAFAFTVDGRELVLRIGRYGGDFAKDAWMAASPGSALRVPAVTEFGAIPGSDLWFIVAERAHGSFLDELDGAQMSRVLPDLLAILIAARSVDISTTVGYGLWDPPGQAPHASWAQALLSVPTAEPMTRLHGWRRALADSPTGAEPFDAGLAALRDLVAEMSVPRQLIHGDLLYRNVLIDGAKVSAVLDWGNSWYGDGLYDLAWLRYWWRWYPAWRNIDIASIIDDHLTATGERSAQTRHRLRCAEIHIGLAAQAYNALTGRFDHLAANAKQTLELVAS